MKTTKSIHIKSFGICSLSRALGLTGLLAVAGMLASAQAHVGSVLQFTATTGNTNENYTYLDDPALNRKRTLKLIVTQDSVGTDNPSPIGVAFISGTWTVFNQDRSLMPLGARFNVQVVTKAVYASPLNSAYDFTLLSEDRKAPNALLLETPLWGFDSKIGGVYVNHNQGLVYGEEGSDQWAIINQDGADAVASAYNVADVTKEANAFVLTTSASNIDGGDGVYIDENASNNNPDAVIFVTPVVVGGVTWDHPVGVHYVGPEWEIFNEDGATMPAGLTFNVEDFAGPIP